MPRDFNALQNHKIMCPFLPFVYGQIVRWRSNSSRSRARSCKTSRHPGIRAVVQEIHVQLTLFKKYMIVWILSCSRNTIMNFTLFKKCIYEFNPVQERQVYSRYTYRVYEFNPVQEIQVWIKPCLRNKCMNKTLFMKYMYEFNLVQGMHEWIKPFMKYKSEHKEIIKAYLFSISISTTIYVTLKLNCHIKTNLTINLTCLTCLGQPIQQFFVSQNQGFWNRAGGRYCKFLI